MHRNAPARTVRAIIAAVLAVTALAAAPTAMAAPHVAVIPSATTFFGGETATIGFEVVNPPDGVLADFYVGFVHPDGASVFTLSPTGGLLGPLGPLSQAVPTRSAPPGFAESTPNLVSVAVPAVPAAGIPPGTYLYFALLLRAGSLQDNTLDEADILAVDLKPLLYRPVVRSPNPSDPFILGTATAAGTTVELFGEKDPAGAPTRVKELRTTDVHGAIALHEFDAVQFNGPARLSRILNQHGRLDLDWQSPTHANAHLRSLDGAESLAVPIVVAAGGVPVGPPGAVTTGLVVGVTRDAERCGAPVPVHDAQLVLVLYDTGSRRRWYVSNGASLVGRGQGSGNFYPTRIPVPSPVGAASAATCDGILALTATACSAGLAAGQATCTAAGPLSDRPRLQEFCAVVNRNDPGVCDALAATLAADESGTSVCTRASQVDDIAGEATQATVTLTPVAVIDGALLVGASVGGVNPAGPLPDLSLAVATSRDCPAPGADTIAPDTLIQSGPAETATSTSVTFTWTGTDDVTASDALTYSYQLEGFDQAPTAFGSETITGYSGLTDGATYTFSVQARDAAGNVDPSAARRTFTVRLPVPDVHYIDGDVAFDITSTDSCQRIRGQQGSVDFVFPGGNDAGATARITLTLVLSPGPNTSCTGVRTLTITDRDSAPLSVNGEVVSVTAGPIAFTGTRTASSITGSATISVTFDGRTFPPTAVTIAAPRQ